MPKNKKKSAKSKYNKKHYNKSSQQNNVATEEVAISDKPINDYTWYQVSETIGRAGASIPYNIFTGTREDLDITAKLPFMSNNVSDASNRSTPGVLCINYNSIPGSSYDAASAVNVASRGVYSWVRHMNSGSKNYEAPDLMIYILAVLDIYGQIGEARRIYRLANTYIAENRYIPDLILRALGADPDNIRENLANYLYRLNLIIKKVSTLLIPSDFTVFQRQALLTTGVFVDSSSIRSQFYAFKRKCNYNFDFATDSHGGRLVPVKISSGLRTWDKIIDDIETAFMRVIEDEDMGVMAGDIRKAYGEENCYSISEVNELETQEFNYDEDVLNQIENAFCSPVSAFSGTQWPAPVVDQINGYLRCRVLTKFTDSVYSKLQTLMGVGKRFFNSHKDNPQWSDNLEWSRLSNAVDDNPGDLASGSTVSWNASSEQVDSFELFCYKYGNIQSDRTIYSYKFHNIICIPVASDVGYLETEALMLLSMFDWHPICYVFLYNDNINSSQFLSANYDAKMHTIVDSSQFVRMNEMATMGMFARALDRHK